MADVKTLEEAFEFVESVGICTIFSEKAKGIPSLWDAVDLPEGSGGQTKWGAKVEAIWAWKNELPETYPEDVYYGKIPGGHAALMTIQYLRETHYAVARKPISDCSELAQHVYEMIRLNPNVTGEFRRESVELYGCTKSRFDTALKQLQVTLNIVRSNEPGLNSDTWVPFSEVYLDLVGE
ncbi:MAG: hypothetical protein P8L49_06280 [Opitutaceae bacterium]|nr:hypothetical protein [Opitutaceae bacterium]